MARGGVKSFDPAKGYGFLAVEGGKDVFFHGTSVEGADAKSLAAGTKVRFEVKQGPRGPEATNVVVVSDTDP
jgi:CspA family cold shock protein